MREIKFRGKRISDGEWIIGNLITETDSYLVGNRTFIHLRLSPVNFSQDSLTSKLCLHEVDPETVGQYTGLKDKNGREVYEGDVIKNPNTRSSFKLYYSETGACYRVERLSDGWHFDLSEIRFRDDIEVIGNIYEDKHLLKEESQ